MIPINFQDFLNIALVNSYWIIFIIMILEGPTITTAAAFVASLGYLNIWVIFFLSIAGDLIGDFLHYTIGYFGRMKIIDKYDHIFKINKRIIDKIEKHYHKHLGKTLFLIKFTPLATPGLLLAGASKVPVKKFVYYSLLITLPRAIFFTSLGFFFGFAIEKALKYFQLTQYLILALVVLIGVIFLINKFAVKKLYKWLKE